MGSVTIKDIDHGYDQLQKALQRVDTQAVNVGVSDKPHDPSGQPTDIIASFHEFGYGVPERSFLRAWADEHKQAIQTKLHESISNTLITGEDWRKPFGNWCVDEIRKRIWAHIPPPLAAATIRRKDFDVPLIDSKQLVDAILVELEG